MLLAARSSCATGRVFNIVDEPQLDQGGVATALRRASEGQIRTRFLPYAVGWLLMRGVDLATFLLKRQPGTAGYRLARTVADMRFRCEAARRELGWSPRISPLDGLTITYRAGLPDPYPH
jgi:nucleoside-diphosphate-sugar epimerase